jgi:hypothetical protein
LRLRNRIARCTRAVTGTSSNSAAGDFERLDQLDLGLETHLLQALDQAEEAAPHHRHDRGRGDDRAAAAVTADQAVGRQLVQRPLDGDARDVEQAAEFLLARQQGVAGQHPGADAVAQDEVDLVIERGRQPGIEQTGTEIAVAVQPVHRRRSVHVH